MLGNTTLKSPYDIIIVGAGIVGAACAAACAGGGLKTLVLDSGPIGGGATASGMGHIVVLDDSEAQFQLTSYSRRLWHELAPKMPSDIEFDRCGTLWVAADEMEMAEVDRKHRYFSERGVRTEVLDAEALAKAEPNLRPGLAGGLVVPDDSVLYPPAAARFLLETAPEGRLHVRNDASVVSLSDDAQVVMADGERLSASLVVNAAGAWSPLLTPGLPIRKRKGHLVITDRYPGFVRHQIVELGYLKSAHSAATDSVAFNIQPRKNGQMLLGSSRQFGAEETTIDSSILNRMLRRAFEYLPAFAELSAIRCWTGHRAATPDKLPFIGPSRSSDRVWLATGHEGLGITTSLGTGRLLADLILKKPTAIPAAPYAPSRPMEGGHHG